MVKKDNMANVIQEMALYKVEQREGLMYSTLKIGTEALLL